MKQPVAAAKGCQCNPRALPAAMLRACPQQGSVELARERCTAQLFACTHWQSLLSTVQEALNCCCAICVDHAELVAKALAQLHLSALVPC